MREQIAKVYRRIPILRELCQIRELLGECNTLLNRLNTADTIRMRDFDLPNHPRYGDPQRLVGYHTQVCSQDGEDGIIQEIFRRIGVTTREFVEIGVGSGDENNTAYLLSQGWTGYWIDGSSEFVRTLAARDDLPKDALRYLVSFVTAENVGSLFKQLGVPKEFDLLSLDIDQNTYYAWESLAAYQPRVVVIEYNAALPADVDWKVPYHAERTWDGTQNFGASLKAFELLGRKLGYSLVGCDLIGVNAFFVRRDLASNRFSEPFTAENHYEPPRYPLQGRRSHRPSILDRNTASSAGEQSQRRKDL